MQVSGIVALFIVYPHGALAASCPAGYKKKSSLTNWYCTSSATDAASCNTNCCELDDTKCLNYAGSLSCATGKVPASAGTATAAGGADKNTDCCTAKAACSTGTCSAGYKKKSPLTNLLCDSSATDAASCNTNCCEPDDTKCLYYAPGGASPVSCATGRYYATASAGTATTAGGANFKEVCCIPKASCSDFVNFGNTGGASKSETMLALTLGMFAVAALLS